MNESEPVPETLRSQDELNVVRNALATLDALENWARIRELIASGPATTNGKTSHIETVQS